MGATAGVPGLSTALVRSPYGLRGMIGTATARPLAERGYQVLIQSTRGTFGSSGAFPRFARNPGTGEPHAAATTLVAADQSIYHDPTHPPAVSLPVSS